MIIWTDYMQYRAKLRGFDLNQLEQIVNYSTERYYDTETGRHVVIGRYDKILVILPYEMSEDGVTTPITVHTITRQQISSRLNTGRFTYD